jgi:hypothetical protein
MTSPAVSPLLNTAEAVIIAPIPSPREPKMTEEQIAAEHEAWRCFACRRHHGSVGDRERCVLAALKAAWEEIKQLKASPLNREERNELEMLRETCDRQERMLGDRSLKARGVPR